MTKDKLKEKAQAKHFTEICNAEQMYNDQIDLATDVLNVPYI